METANITAIEQMVKTMETLFPIAMGLGFILSIFAILSFHSDNRERRGEQESSDVEPSDYEKQIKELRDKIIK